MSRIRVFRSTREQFRTRTEEDECSPAKEPAARPILPSRNESRARIRTEVEGPQELMFSRVVSKYTGSSRPRVRKVILIPEECLLPHKPVSIRQVESLLQETKLKSLSEKEFVYLAKEEVNDYYNLHKINYPDITRHSIDLYFTLSIRGLTRYQHARAVEFMPLEEWLFERDRFNLIKELSFFIRFRKWKLLKHWIRLLARDRVVRVRAELKNQLFLLNFRYRRILLSHRKSCG